MLCRYFYRRRARIILNAIILAFAVIMIFMFVVHFQEDREQRQAILLQERSRIAIKRMSHIIPDYSLRRSGPGENGKGVYLEGEAKERGRKDMKTWFMNVVASDLISLDRSLPDPRPPECRLASYSSNLPLASVIIIFTDEAWSPLIRTVHSVINRSPLHLLLEVLLVDDFSQRNELKANLDAYIERFGGLARVIRSNERLGLIRAKLFGAKQASGDVVVFLDSHCEVNQGWLEPLLARIKEKKSAVICPIIDHLSAETMEYHGDKFVSSVGGFWWSLHFRWDPIPEKERNLLTTALVPVRSPTMAGGLLAANREYFFEVGGYDPGMDIWGGENLEISFRVWMCGGSIEFIPCSHVGHIFRSGHPYNMTGTGGNKDVHGTNSKRLAEVWMDDYKRLFYMHRYDLETKDVGDLSDRIALRKNLRCKSFKWYLDNVAPNKFIPDENVLGYGALMNPSTGLCLDTLQRDEKTPIKLGVFHCQGRSSSQIFSLTNDGYLRRELTCASVSEDNSDSTRGSIIMPNCVENSEKWIFENGLMKNMRTALCLDVDGIKSGDDVVVRSCSSTTKTQLWEFFSTKVM